MKNIIFLLTLIFTYVDSYSQQISGTVKSQAGEPLVGASVVVPGTTRGTVTDPDGYFAIEVTPEDTQLAISYVGFLADTITLDGSASYRISLQETEAMNEVVVRGSTTFVDELNPIHTDVITEKELLKAACCNLSESFETNASVDVSYSDAVTGARQIQMLGLDGTYVQINRENIPNVRGLTTRFGLGFIPGTWIQSIDVGKGAGSVVTGFESMTGQINVELKKPENMEKFYFNTYLNHMGRGEINLHGSKKISDKLESGLFVHGNYFGNDVDMNDDNFMDIPKSRQINVLNRWKYSGDRIVSQVGVNYLVDQKRGGQIGYDWDDNASTSSLYGYDNSTKKAEVFGKVGVLFPQQPYKGIGFIYSGAYQEIDANFGRNSYFGEEKTLYTNFIYQTIIGNTFHQVKTGASYLYDEFDEAYNDSTFARTESVPGVFLEYSWLPNDNISAVVGLRNDFHNLFGNQFSPRVHFRYALPTKTTLRLSAGRGFRVPNTLAENTGILVSSRQIVAPESLEPEVAWNYGATLTQDLKLFGKQSNMSIDYYYTDFENQLVVDRDRDPSSVYFTNLSDESYAHSFQVELSTQLMDRLDAKVAYKYYDIKTKLDNQLQEVPFISSNRFFFNLGYSTLYDIWKFDFTGQFYGSQRLPDTSMNPEQYQLDARSPDFFTANAQVSRAFRWGEVYLGGENLTNFRQESPIVAADDPFGPNFDASLAWGPIVGRMIYTGIRIKID